MNIPSIACFYRFYRANNSRVFIALHPSNPFFNIDKAKGESIDLKHKLLKIQALKFSVLDFVPRSDPLLISVNNNQDLS